MVITIRNDEGVETNFDIQSDRFTFENHNFQSGQVLKYVTKDIIRDAVGTATTVVENSFSYPSPTDTFDSPFDSYDSTIRTFDEN